MATRDLTTAADTPFKLAAFEFRDDSRIGMLCGDRIIDIGRAAGHLRRGGISVEDMPASMLALIEQYDVLAPGLHRIAGYFADPVITADCCHSPEAVRLLAPVKYPWNLIAIAANYRRHAEEMGHEESVDPDRDAPYLFAKSPRSCITDPGTPFVIPEGREKIDWEGELAIVMGKTTRNASLEDALDHVFGFTILFDVSDRGARYRKNPSFGIDWFSMKSLDGAAPMGPYLVPREFLPDYQRLPITTRVNDTFVQQSSTAYMIYDAAHLIAFASSIMTLYPGDIIATGTPEGVGVSRKPPVFLQRGDCVSISIEGIGTLETPIT